MLWYDARNDSSETFISNIKLINWKFATFVCPQPIHFSTVSDFEKSREILHRRRIGNWIFQQHVNDKISNIFVSGVEASPSTLLIICSTTLMRGEEEIKLSKVHVHVTTAKLFCTRVAISERGVAGNVVRIKLSNAIHFQWRRRFFMMRLVYIILNNKKSSP